MTVEHTVIVDNPTDSDGFEQHYAEHNQLANKLPNQAPANDAVTSATGGIDFLLSAVE